MATLDLLQQRTVSTATRQLLRRVLQIAPVQSDLMLSHARLYFEDFSRDECIAPDDKALRDLLAQDQQADSLTNYFCYVLMDFASADRELEELPLANALQIAESLGFKETFMPMARKELKLRKNQIDQWDRTKLQILEAAKLAKPGS